MSLLKLPEPKALSARPGIEFEPPSDVVARWSATRPLAEAASGDATITIYDYIGEDPWTGGGVTAKRIRAALASIGKRDVTVRMNSPGGSLTEGVTIYNELRKHPAAVNVEIMGMAASAASVIAMAGDTIAMGPGSIMYVHNAWGVAIGNRHVFEDMRSVFAEFDEAMIDIYAARTDRSRQDIAALMDGPTKASDGTFMSASRAVEEGFATSVEEALSSDDESAARASAGSAPARRRIEAALAREGVTRKERSEMIAELLAEAGGTQAARDAGRHRAARDAGAFEDSLNRLMATMKEC